MTAPEQELQLHQQPDAPRNSPPAETGNPLKDAIEAEVLAMLRFAWSRGLSLPADVGQRINSLDAAVQGPSGGMGVGLPLAALAELHADLARAVAPAMPITLLLMENPLNQKGWRAIAGPIDNLRRLMIAAVAFMLLFIGISLCSSLNAETMRGDIYNLNGPQQMVVMIFLLSAAGIGGTFQALFTAHRYAANANYDPHYDSSYWILIALGLVAGLLLSVLVPVNIEGTESPTLAKPVLALLGGFSASLVYRILQRLVDTLDSLFQPHPSSK